MLPEETIQASVDLKTKMTLPVLFIEENMFSQSIIDMNQ